jgi:hypothetical protein
VSFRFLGLVVLALGVLHLYATVLVRDSVLARIADPAVRGFISPGYLLDHVLVGVLLLPIGLLMVWSSRALGNRERWAFVLNLVFSLTFLTFPLLLVALMVRPEFRAPAFSVASALATLVALGSSGVLFWARRDFRP